MTHTAWMGMNHYKQDCKLLAGCKQMEMSAVERFGKALKSAKYNEPLECPECK